MSRIERRLRLFLRRANLIVGAAVHAMCAVSMMAGALAGSLVISAPAMAEGSPPAQGAGQGPALAVPSAPGSSRRRLPGPYPIAVLRVIDGDTFVARALVWPGVEIVARVRLRGVDAPELGGRCARERRLAGEAKRALADALASGRPMLRDVSSGKYAGRVIASVEVATFAEGDVHDVGAMLLAAGYVQPYRGRRADWCAHASK